MKVKLTLFFYSFAQARLAQTTDDTTQMPYTSPYEQGMGGEEEGQDMPKHETVTF